jgi:hypothetical protein
MGNYKIINSANITKTIKANIDIGLFFFILAEFMILYCKDNLGCIDNNNIELINNVFSNVINYITIILQFS